MKVVVEIGLDNAAFGGSGELGDPVFVMLTELHRVLDTVPWKVGRQLARDSVLCDAPEEADVLMDVNGNTVGAVRLEGAWR